MLSAVAQSGCGADDIVHRSCAAPRAGTPQAESQPGESEHSESLHAEPQHALAGLAAQSDGTCACVEFLKQASQGPFTLRDEAVLRILSTELFAEPMQATPADARPISRTWLPDSHEEAERRVDGLFSSLAPPHGAQVTGPPADLSAHRFTEPPARFAESAPAHCAKPLTLGDSGQAAQPIRTENLPLTE
jgi:hypothetical protein